jgi:hypothetical protein
MLETDLIKINRCRILLKKVLATRAWKEDLFIIITTQQLLYTRDEQQRNICLLLCCKEKIVALSTLRRYNVEGAELNSVVQCPLQDINANSGRTVIHYD